MHRCTIIRTLLELREDENVTQTLDTKALERHVRQLIVAGIAGFVLPSTFTMSILSRSSSSSSSSEPLGKVPSKVPGAGMWRSEGILPWRERGSGTLKMRST
ncbi:hypothetical protein V8F33_004523 [Rhypophila sp. PSN 637]